MDIPEEVKAEAWEAWDAYKAACRAEFPDSRGPVLGRHAFVAGWAAREAREHTPDDEVNCWIDGEGWPCRFRGDNR